MEQKTFFGLQYVCAFVQMCMLCVCNRNVCVSLLLSYDFHMKSCCLKFEGQRKRFTDSRAHKERMHGVNTRNSPKNTHKDDCLLLIVL